MSFDNLSTVITSVEYKSIQTGNFLTTPDTNGRTGYNTSVASPVFRYTGIGYLEASVPHKDQLEISVIFPYTNVSHDDRQAMFVIPKNDSNTFYSIDETTKGITLNLSAFSTIPAYTSEAGVSIAIPVTITTAGTRIVIRRKTYSLTPYVTHVPGSRLTSFQLNLATKQTLNLIQELSDRVGTDFLAIDDRFTYNGFVDLDNTQTIVGAKTFSAATGFTNTVAVTGAVTMASTLATTGAATLSSTLAVTGNTTVGGTFNATGNALLGGTLGVTGVTTIGGNTAITGSMTATTLGSVGTTFGVGTALTVGTTMQAGGVVTLTDTTASTSSSTGSVKISGGVGILKDSFINTVRVGLGNSSVAGNTVLGTDALLVNTSGVRNSVVGNSAGTAILTGTDNTSFGFEAMKSLTTNHFSTAIGSKALKSLVTVTTGTDGYNTAVGYAAMENATLGRYNTALGSLSLRANTAATNTAVGYGSLTTNTSGLGNVAVGYNSSSLNLSGSNNTSIGTEALRDSVTGNGNVSIGSGSLLSSNGSGGNTAVGQTTMTYLVSGCNYNTALGWSAGNTLLSGSENTFVGSSAGGSYNPGSTQNRCTSVGVCSGENNTSTTDNTFVGYSSGRKVTSGDYNTAVGSEALSFGSITGNYNTAIGNVAGYNTTTTANNNCYLGYAAGYKVTTGTQNTILGAEAGTGDVNTAPIYNTTGSNNTLIGYRAVPSANTISNEITLGNSSVITLRCAAALTSLSDSRDKKDVLPLAYGLDFLNLLRPVSFTWDCRDGSRAGQTSSGFIAQEVKAAQESIVGATEALHLVYEANPEQLEMTAGNLLPVLVKAIQELSIRIKALEVIQNG
jgi:trimeric autotransporter adhesin